MEIVSEGHVRPNGMEDERRQTCIDIETQHSNGQHLTRDHVAHSLSTRFSSDNKYVENERLYQPRNYYFIPINFLYLRFFSLHYFHLHLSRIIFVSSFYNIF